MINDFFGISFPLPLTFDINRLNADLEEAEKFEFSAHPLRYHDGTWTAINLIYGGGGNHYTHEGDHGYGVGEPQPTEVLKACPYFAEVLEQFPGKIKMARLSALPPDGRIRRHYDPIESADFDQLRIHIPIRSNPKQVIFHLGFKRQYWHPGRAWYGDFTLPHSVHNKAPYTRVSMILDLEMDDEARAFFPDSYFAPKAVARRKWFRKETRSLSWRLDKLAESRSEKKSA